MTKYRYEGPGERRLSSKDFTTIGHEDQGAVSFVEGNDYVADLPDDVADKLISMGEPLVKVQEGDDGETKDPADPGDGPESETAASNSPTAGEGTKTSGTRARGNA